MLETLIKKVFEVLKAWYSPRNFIHCGVEQVFLYIVSNYQTHQTSNFRKSKTSHISSLWCFFGRIKNLRGGLKICLPLSRLTEFSNVTGICDMHIYTFFFCTHDKKWSGGRGEMFIFNKDSSLLPLKYFSAEKSRTQHIFIRILREKTKHERMVLYVELLWHLREKSEIDKVQISFQFGWCSLYVICDENKGSIKHWKVRIYLLYGAA